MKKLLHRLALRFERFVDRFKKRQQPDRIIEGYAGYATPTHLIARGRVLTSLRRNQPLPTQSWFTNLRQMVSLFLTDEVADVTLHSGEVSAQSDEEGYFTLLLPHDKREGWVDIPVIIEGREDAEICPVLIPSANAEFMIISDIDDTLLKTGAYSLLRNLWTSMTGNALSRHIFPDAIDLLTDLSSNGRNPVFYVSSSPWNLYNFLTEIFERNGLVRGPMFLRDLGLSDTKFITDGHGNHKGSSIDTILAARPDLPVILIGDSGQKDASIYSNAIKRNPNRIKAVILREADDGLSDHDKADMAKISESDAMLFHANNFDGMYNQLMDVMNLPPT